MQKFTRLDERLIDNFNQNKTGILCLISIMLIQNDNIITCIKFKKWINKTNETKTNLCFNKRIRVEAKTFELKETT